MTSAASTMASMPVSIEHAAPPLAARSGWQRVDHAFMALVRSALAALLGLMACVIFANVLSRHLHWGALVWAEEVARYAMVWLTFLGIGPVFRSGGHIAIENLQDAVPSSVARTLRLGIWLGMVALAVGLVLFGWQYMGRAQFQLTASTQVSFRWVYAAMPAGGLVLLWCLLATAGDYVRERTFDQPEHEADDLPGERP
jgi:TRAP-type transport system small permease protein